MTDHEDKHMDRWLVQWIDCIKHARARTHTFSYHYLHHNCKLQLIKLIQCNKIIHIVCHMHIIDQNICVSSI